MDLTVIVADRRQVENKILVIGRDKKRLDIFLLTVHLYYSRNHRTATPKTSSRQS